MRDSIVFYKSFVEALKELPDEDRLKLYDAIFEFGLYGNEPKLSGVNAAVFKLVRPQIEANNRKYENGLKGGRPKPNNNQSKTKAKPNNNQTITKAEPNDNDNVNDNDNDNVNASGSDVVLSLVSYLNSKTGSSYRETEQVRELIESKLNDGYSVEDLKSVIDKKSVEWSCDGKMRTYLRPSTLFGEKFEEYLNAPDPVEVEQERGTTKKFEQLQAERDKKSSELKRITNRILQIGGVNMKDNYDEYEDLKLQAAVLEQEIDSLDDRLQKRAGVVS